MENQPGKLIVLSLPIGNMQDITLRALETLKEKEVLLAEDTRELIKLLRHYEIPHKQLISYRDQNHDRVLPQILEILNSGQDVVLTSDRGTPTISDPGYKLVRDTLNHGIEVVSLPGPSAVTSALSISGLSTDRFVFLGFLPRKNGKRVKTLQEFVPVDTTFILYESPFRISKVLESVLEAFGDIEVAAAKELTKVHEQVLRGHVTELLSDLKDKKLKGEWVVMGRRTS